MKSLKKLFSKGSVPDKNSEATSPTEETARPTMTRGIKALCNSLGICLDDLYRAISGNKVVWKLPLSKDDKVEGLTFVDANTGEIYVLHFDQSKQSVKIDPEP